MLNSKEEFQANVKAIVDDLAGLADSLASDGMLVASGRVLAGRQAVRQLWTMLNPPPQTETPVAEVAT